MTQAFCQPSLFDSTVTLNFPNPATQTPLNTWSPTSTPSASTNGLTYVWDGEKWGIPTSASDPGIPEAPIDGRQYGRQSATWTEVQASGDNSVTYNGASAWGDIEDDGTIQNGLNIASVTNTGTGTYDVAFTTPMPDANYSLVGSIQSVGSTSSRVVSFNNKTVIGFSLRTRSGSNNANLPFSFAVHSQNALPPAGTTGTDAWGTCQSDGTLDAGYNIASVTKNNTGRFSVVFTTPMPTANYAVNGTAGGDSITSSTRRTVHFTNRTTTGFDINLTAGDPSVWKDSKFSFTVNATNANLPYTFTKEQIEAAISNTGAYAWASTAGDGTIEGGNGLTCTRTGVGTYQYTFNTPLPDANYAVSGTVLGGNSNIISINSKSATSFSVLSYTRQDAINYSDETHSVVVTAAQGQPLSLGGGADAWARAAADATLLQGHNIASVNKTATGRYYVAFATPMPTANYSVCVSSSATNIVNAGSDNHTVDGFTAWGRRTDDGSWSDFDFSTAIFATDGNAGGFWGRSNDGVLTPANSTDDVQIASLNGGQLAGLRNILINGNLTINQRGVDVASVATGEYGQDRWKKTAGGMTQIIEEGNFVPGAVYTLSGINVTTQQLTAPGSGDWTLPDILVTARQIQLELGVVATPFELRPKALELMLCERYYLAIPQINWGSWHNSNTTSTTYTFPTTMRAAPTVNLGTKGTGSGTWTADQANTRGFRIYTAVSTTTVGYMVGYADAEL